MKPLLLSLLLASLAWSNNYNTDWVDKAVEEIQPPRNGVESQTVDQLTNPFLYGVVEEKKVVKNEKIRYQRASAPSVSFNVTAIINNSAKINNRWLTVGRQISGYTLLQTMPEYVILKKAGKKPIKVYLNRKNKKIQLKTK